MPRQVLRYTELDQSSRLSPRRTKFAVKIKLGLEKPHTPTQSPREEPVGVKNNPLHFLHKKSDEETIVHWTRAGRCNFPPIKLLPPW